MRLNDSNSLRRAAAALALLACVSCASEGDGTDPQGGEEERPLIDVPGYFSQDYAEPADNPTTAEGVELGRLLFYDRRLSVDNSLSCAGCHRPQFAFGDDRPLSRGVQGGRTDRNTPPLSNLLWVPAFHWDGSKATLEEQALAPIQHPEEMNQSLEATVAKLEEAGFYQQYFEAAFGDAAITSERVAKAIAQFERTMISSESRYDAYLRGEYEPTALELQGIELFFTHPEPEIGLRGGNCGDCHLGPLAGGARTGFDGFHNNGLDTDAQLDSGLAAITGNAADMGKFRAPSLRNVALTAPYMHDGRFQTLEEVLDHYNEGVIHSATLDPLIIEASNEVGQPQAGQPIRLFLTEEEKDAILAFLDMLTDESFTQDERFANPFGPGGVPQGG